MDSRGGGRGVRACRGFEIGSGWRGIVGVGCGLGAKWWLEDLSKFLD